MMDINVNDGDMVCLCGARPYHAVIMAEVGDYAGVKAEVGELRGCEG